ncbi:NAD(P)-dependent oxidoreductase [Kitasatospora terrestris]|uniref:NAD(P)-dependent oxidoreductase n=1 Tax=Kitasatospora terrestris TaxID=258051 RepID=A0ABP9DGF4_9ACTN
MVSIAVVGANGNIGRCLVTEALARGHLVTAVVRDPDRYQGLAMDVLPGDVLEPEDVARVAAGQDALVSAVGGGRVVAEAARSLVAGLRELDDAAPRLLVVGGAGSLLVGPGVRVWDDLGLPAPLRRTMHAHGEALEYLETVADLAWTVLSPAELLEPGARTGRYRTGTDHLLVGPDGRSRITVADYAVALVDELENPRHLGERFTVGY